jgi:hypothetical protein
VCPPADKAGRPEQGPGAEDGPPPSVQGSGGEPGTLQDPGVSGDGAEGNPTEAQISSLRAGIIETLAHSSKDVKLLEAKVDKILCKKFKKHCKKKKSKGKGAIPALHGPVAAADRVTPEAAAAPLYDRVSAVRAALSPLTAPVAEGLRTELRHSREDLTIPAGSNPSLVAPLLNPLGTAAQVASGVAQLPASLVAPITAAPAKWASSASSPAAAPLEAPAPAAEPNHFTVMDGVHVFKEMQNAHAPVQYSGEMSLPFHPFCIFHCGCFCNTITSR